MSMFSWILFQSADLFFLISKMLFCFLSYKSTYWDKPLQIGFSGFICCFYCISYFYEWNYITLCILCCYIMLSLLNETNQLNWVIPVSDRVRPDGQPVGSGHASRLPAVRNLWGRFQPVVSVQDQLHVLQQPQPLHGRLAGLSFISEDEGNSR